MPSRLCCLVACAVLSSACAPAYLAVRQSPVSLQLPDGPTQGPFKLSVPLEKRWPHRVTLSYSGRCHPLFTADVSVSGREALHSSVGSQRSQWQHSLRQHFLGARAPVPTPVQPVQPMPPGPPPGVGVEVAGGGQVRPGQAAGAATATATVTLPGHWEQQITVDQVFEEERVHHCGVAGTDTTVIGTAFDPGLTALEAVMWSEIPQFIEGGTLSVVVEQLQPPETPKAPAKPPAAGAVWVAGTWSWHNDGPDSFGWVWAEGSWAAPPGGPPPLKNEGHGTAPNPGAVWADGSWSWDGREGWVWASGRWYIPAQPMSSPPPPRSESRGSAPLGAQWVSGSWRWDLTMGWVWVDGRWFFPAQAPGAPPPPRNESPGTGPLGAFWAAGSWQWQGGVGWVWLEGRWAFSATPPGPPPAPQDDSHGEPDCPGWVWVPGQWRWTTTSGWAWTRGSWGEKKPGPLPPPQVESKGFSPSSDAVWVNGKWGWDVCHAEYIWLRGQWRTHARAPSEEPPVQRRPPPPPSLPQTVTTTVQVPVEPVCQRTMTAPPPPRVEEQSPSPVAGSIWIPGLWKWAHCDWEWTAGRWNVPPAPNMVWVPGPTIELGRWVVGGSVQAVPPPRR